MRSDPQGRKGDVDRGKPRNLRNGTAPGVAPEIAVTLLTGESIGPTRSAW